MAQDIMAPNGRDLLRPYADVLVGDGSAIAVRGGWRTIVTDLFDGWAAEMLRNPGARLVVGSIGERAGALAIVCDAVDRVPAGHFDMHEVRRLQHQAEVASLRTCERCGRPGVLRRVDDVGFATRCKRHAGTVTSHLPDSAAHVSAEIVGNVLRSHGDWLASDGAFTDVPRGWLGLVTDLFARLKELLKAKHGVGLLDMRASRGRLVILLRLDSEVRGSPQYPALREALMAVGDAAFFTCDVCGGEGRVRPTTQGAPTPRCDAHADMHRWPPRHCATPVRITDPEAVLSSARPSWTAEGPRVAARAPTSRVIEDPSRGTFALYDVRDVEAALGLAHRAAEDPFESGPRPPDNEHQIRLRKIIERGEAGRWRRLARPERAMVDRLDELASRAPHLEVLSSLVRRHLLAALHIGLPVSLPPLLVVGPPGIGKSWYLKGLSGVLGIPFRDLAMSGASHSGGIGGAHPVWRNAQPGAVAKVLLGEEVANPLLFVDELDKVPPHTGVDDLYRPYFLLLEPVGARQFTDGFLGFPIDASAINWVMAANGTQPIPPPILNRLTVVSVASPDQAHLVAVASSVYADCNARRLSFFPPEPAAGLVAKLVHMTPRAMRIAVDDAMTSAAAEGRREVRASDVLVPAASDRLRMGFL